MTTKVTMTSSIDAESDIGTEMNLRIAGLNCNGLLNKVDSLLASANEPHSDWNIICVQETHETLYQKMNQQFQRQGWAFYSSTIHDHEHENNNNDLLHASGGTGIYTANSLTELWSIEQHETSTSRITHISLSDDNITIHIFSAYAADSSKPPSVRKQIYNNMNGISMMCWMHLHMCAHAYA
jgi:exonuclease III